MYTTNLRNSILSHSKCNTYVNIYRFVEVAATIFNGGNLSTAMLSNGQVRTYVATYVYVRMCKISLIFYI